MADRLTVALPLVWKPRHPWMRERTLNLGPVMVGSVSHACGVSSRWAAATVNVEPKMDWGRDLGTFPTRSAAMRAVEAAVMKALGAEGGGDE